MLCQIVTGPQIQNVTLNVANFNLIFVKAKNELKLMFFPQFWWSKTCLTIFNFEFNGCHLFFEGNERMKSV